MSAVKVDDPRDIQGAYEDRFNNSHELADAENNAIQDYANDGIGQMEDMLKGEADRGAAARAAEQAPKAAWQDNTTKAALGGAASAGGLQGLAQKGKMLFKKKGATIAIVALLGGGAAVPFISSAMLPFAILGNMNAKSILLGLDQYNKDFMGFKLFGSKNGVVKNGAKGKLAGLNKAEIKQLEANGVQFQGKSYNKVTGKTTFNEVKFKDGNWVKAGKEFNTEMKKNPAFRKAMVFKKTSFWKANKSAAAAKVKSIFKINPNPDISGKDDAERNKKMYSESMGDTDGSLGSEVNNRDPDDESGRGSNISEVTDEAQDEIDKTKAALAEGTTDPKLATESDMGNIAKQLDKATLEDSSSVANKLWKFLDPLEPLEMVCTGYQIAHTAETIARTVALANIVRFASNIATVIDRAKAGDDDGEALKYLMTMLQQKDPETGRSFDATSYASVLFNGKLSSEPSSVSAFGGQAMVALMASMHSLHMVFGAGNAAQGRANLRSGCNIATNFGVQIIATVGSLIGNFFTGGAASAGINSLKAALKGGIKAVTSKLKSTIVEKFTKKAAEIGEVGFTKYLARGAWSKFKGMWGSLKTYEKVGFMFAAASTFAMPYIVNSLSGGNIGGYMQNGVTAFDALGTGNDKYESMAGIAAGGTVATYATAAAYQKTQDEYQQQYLADMRYDAKDTPLDLTTPYSTLGTMVTSMQNTIGLSASTNIVATLKSVATLPLRLPGFSSVALAADAEPTPEAIGEQIGDEFSKENQIALTVTGSPQVVFNKTLSFEDFVDKFVDVENPQVTYGGDDEETGEPLFSIITGSELDEYARKCHDPDNAEIDPEYREDGLDYRKECIEDAKPDYDDALRFINQLSPDAVTSTGGSEGAVSAGGFAWPFSEADYNANKADYLGGHISTGTAWGDDGMGTSNKGAYIAADIGKTAGTPVHAMFAGTVTSVNLCGAQDGVAIKSDVNGKTLGIAYMHGDNQRVQVGQTVNAGDVIMDVGTRGCNVYGAHLHIGIAYDGQYLCPQDVFLGAAAGNTTFDFSAMTKKAAGRCGRT